VCWISKATKTHPEYVILIAFPGLQWLRERPPMLLYTYSACLVIFGLVQFILRGCVTPFCVEDTNSRLHRFVVSAVTYVVG
jgi:hypothetical protein